MLTGHGQGPDLGRAEQIQRLVCGGSGSTGVNAHRSSPEHGGAEAIRGYTWVRDARMLTKRSRGRGEADAGIRWSRRVGVQPECVAEVAVAARARRREAMQHLQGTRASEVDDRRLTATRGSELSKRGGQGLTGAAGIGEETRRQQRTPARKCGSLAALCGGEAEGKRRGEIGL